MPDVTANVVRREAPSSRNDAPTERVRKSSSSPRASESTTPNPSPIVKPAPMIAPSMTVSTAAAAVRPHGFRFRCRCCSSIFRVIHLTPIIAMPPRVKPPSTSSGGAPARMLSGATLSATAAITTPAAKCWM